MRNLTLSQQYALRAALGTSLHMLLRTGKHYSTQFVGGKRILGSTVEALLAQDYLRQAEGSKSVVLTAKGTDAAKQLALDYAQASALAAAKAAQITERGRQALARQAHKSAPYSTPATTVRRLPYADN